MNSTLQNYFFKTFQAHKLSDVTWSHAVNSEAKLKRFLQSRTCMCIESDIRMSVDGVLIAAHPPEVESDLLVTDLIQAMKNSKQVLKLDFKDPEAVIPCLELLREAQLTQPVLLNADIFQGTNAPISKFDPQNFISACIDIYPQGVLSVGWTTTADPDDVYTTQQVRQMLALVRGLDEVVFPVRACLLPKSWQALQQLIENENYFFSVWNNEPVDEETLGWIRANLPYDKTFFDFIDNTKEPLQLV